MAVTANNRVLLLVLIFLGNQPQICAKRDRKKDRQKWKESKNQACGEQCLNMFKPPYVTNYGSVQFNSLIPAKMVLASEWRFQTKKHMQEKKSKNESAEIVTSKED